MFDIGIKRLLDELPKIDGLDPDTIRRLLSGAFVDVISIKDLGETPEAAEHLASVRRLATVLELQAIFDGDFSSESTRACAFVAAEALELVRNLSDLADDAESDSIGAIPNIQYTCMEAASLYLIAGFDANAAVAARPIDPDSFGESDPAEAPAAAAMARSAKGLFELRQPPNADSPLPPEDLPISERIRWELWRLISRAIDAHRDWLLTGADYDPASAAERLSSYSRRLDQMQVDSDISHLANLLGAACSATAERALHGLDVDDNGTFASYVHHRARTRPLLWPAAAHYATGALSGEPRHAVVSVPTGAGKSSVAELGIAAVLDQGWVLYLTPTNALANQVTRDLTAQFKDIEGVSVRGFIGGAEFTALGVESVGDVRERQVLVMTPEKCSLALRQSPDAFESLGLMIMDECHLLGNPGSRGVTAELTVSAVLDKAPMVRVLMLSALVENPEEIGKWLAHATDSSYQLIADPWRPTRTLRMVLGIDPVRAQEPFDQARNALEERPKGKNQAFEAPVNLMAGYQGAWETAEESDYTVIPASFSVELNARRGTDGAIRPQPTGYVNQAAGRVTYTLAMAGEGVLTFIPKNKHHNFSVARDLPDLVPKPKSDARLDSVFALLDLADHELGVETVLRNLIERGIAVHTAAMLRDEQRASEVSFADGQARAIFATTTLAQGLNLPATAVVLGGTEIGDGHSLPQDIREERTRSDLLNALGRAGRAYVASRSIGVVIPNQWIQIRRGDSPVAARNSAPFLAYPDASTQIKSQIQTLIRTALDEPEMQVDRLTEEEQATFTFLASDDAEEGQSVLRRSFGAFSTGVNADQALEVSKVIKRAGTNFVESAEAPLWIVEASRISGVGLPAMARLLASLPTEEEALPESIGDWRVVLTSGLGQMPASITARLLPEQPFQSTRMEALVESESDHDQDWNSAAEALDETLALWMDGATLDAIVGPALGKEGGDSGRGSGKPLTKVIALTTNGFGFGVARLAGGLAALWAVTEGADEDAPPGLTSEQRFALDLLPLAVRFGCNDLSSLAWYRWGFRRRRIAHMLAAEIPLPGDLSQDDHSEWVTEVRRALLLGNYEGELSPEADELVEALRLAERV